MRSNGPLLQVTHWPPLSSSPSLCEGRSSPFPQMSLPVAPDTSWDDNLHQGTGCNRVFLPSLMQVAQLQEQSYPCEGGETPRRSYPWPLATVVVFLWMRPK